MRPGDQVREYAILEYYKVLGMLAERAVSELARARCLVLLPQDDENSIKRMRTETDDSASVCLRKGTPPFSNLPDLSDPLAYAEKGGSLLPRQLLTIAAALGSAKRVRGFLTSDMPDGAASVRRLAESIVILPELERHITDAIVSEGELADGASPALRRIRRSIEQQNEKIRESLARFINGKAFDDILMDKVITMRNGRFVVPVKQEQQGRFPGIVHDRSKGGATVFVEPQLVVDMNNKLRELELEEQAEIERILAELSAEVGDAAEAVREIDRDPARYAAMRAEPPFVNNAEPAALRAENIRAFLRSIFDAPRDAAFKRNRILRGRFYERDLRTAFFKHHTQATRLLRDAIRRLRGRKTFSPPPLP